MIINKIASDINNYKKTELYYKSAREGMYDLISNIKKKFSISTIFLPGYIGWSPKEGSGIFDAINKIDDVKIEYYKMTEDLNIDSYDLFNKIGQIDNKDFLVLIVNYFGFKDKNYKIILSEIKKIGGWIIEDNAHGFFTYHMNDVCLSDSTFFSLHKMFPFNYGGSVQILNDQIKKLNYAGSKKPFEDCNPWEYDLNKISKIRKFNYLKLYDLIVSDKCSEYFEPLKKDLQDNIIPQTFPIKILSGNRDSIYEIMNSAGYGVVSLYHTLIKELYKDEYVNSVNISKCILNLPIHQDINYIDNDRMILRLIEACKQTV